jgi:hypothetical protein
LIINVAVTTAIWVAVAYLTPQTDRATLVRFYRLVRPGGRGWESVRAEAGVGPSPDSLAQSLLGWTAGCLFVYSALFGTGAFLYGNLMLAAAWGVALAVSGVVVARVLGAQARN